MSKRLLVIMLLISLFVNVGFVVGLVDTSVRRHYHDLHFGRPPEAPAEGRGRGADWKALEDDNIRALREEFHATKQELMQELSKDPLDEAKVNAIIDKSIATQSKMEQAMGTKLITYRKSMSADAAQERFTDLMNRMERTKNRRRDK